MDGVGRVPLETFRVFDSGDESWLCVKLQNWRTVTVMSERPRAVVALRAVRVRSFDIFRPKSPLHPSQPVRVGL